MSSKTNSPRPADELALTASLLVERAFGEDPLTTLQIDTTTIAASHEQSLVELYSFYAFGVVRTIYRVVDDPTLRDNATTEYLAMTFGALNSRLDDHNGERVRPEEWNRVAGARFAEYDEALRDPSRDPGGRLFHTSAIALEHVLGREHQDAYACLSILGSWNAVCQVVSESATEIAALHRTR